MRRHAVVDRDAAGQKAARLRVVDAVHEAHQLAHHVPVEPRRPEGVLGHLPARREDDEVAVRHARLPGRRAQDSEDRRVGVIEAHRVDRHEAREIVLVRRVAAVPGHHVERRAAPLGGPQPAHELVDHLALRVLVLERRHRREEVARLREALRADQPQLRQAERRAVVLAQIAARLLLEQLHLELDAARNDADLARCDAELSQLGEDQDLAELRDEHQLAVGVDEVASAHRAVGAVDVDRHAGLRRRLAAAGESYQFVQEIGRGVGNRQRIPAQPVGRRLDFVERPRADRPVVDAPERCVHRRRTQPVEPGREVLGARRGERSSGNHLGIQALGRPLRGVLPDRQGAGHRLGAMNVAEAALVLENRSGRVLRRAAGRGGDDHALRLLLLVNPRYQPCGALSIFCVLRKCSRQNLFLLAHAPELQAELYSHQRERRRYPI